MTDSGSVWRPLMWMWREESELDTGRPTDITRRSYFPRESLDVEVGPHASILIQEIQSILISKSDLRVVSVGGRVQRRFFSPL